jgi:ABC-2 type transport system permease protein
MLRNLRGIYIIWYRDLLRFWHDKIRFAGSIVQPLLFLFVFGTGLSSRIGSLGSATDYRQFIFPGIIGMNVIMSSFMAGISLVWDREFGFLKEVLVAPVSRASIVMGKTLGGATVALVQGMALLLLAPLAGVSLTPGNVLLLIPLMLLLATVMGSLGILLASRIHSIEGFQAVMQLLMFPMVFLSGSLFPVQGLPDWLSLLVKINPVTYGVASVREIMLGFVHDAPYVITLFNHQMSIAENIFILLTIGIIIFVSAMYSFEHM